MQERDARRMGQGRASNAVHVVTSLCRWCQLCNLHYLGNDVGTHVGSSWLLDTYSSRSSFLSSKMRDAELSEFQDSGASVLRYARILGKSGLSSCANALLSSTTRSAHFRLCKLLSAYLKIWWTFLARRWLLVKLTADPALSVYRSTVLFSWLHFCRKQTPGEK